MPSFGRFALSWTPMSVWWLPISKSAVCHHCLQVRKKIRLEALLLVQSSSPDDSSIIIIRMASGQVWVKESSKVAVIYVCFFSIFGWMHWKIACLIWKRAWNLYPHSVWVAMSEQKYFFECWWRNTFDQLWPIKTRQRKAPLRRSIVKSSQHGFELKFTLA